jgi:glutamine synthetase adenylyltransferase
MSKSIDDDNLTRYLDKWQETQERCSAYFEKQSESYAAQHLSDRVMYSPICNRLQEMASDIRILRNQMQPEETGPDRIRAAIKKDRGGIDAPQNPQGFA